MAAEHSRKGPSPGAMDPPFLLTSLSHFFFCLLDRKPSAVSSSPTAERHQTLAPPHRFPTQRAPARADGRTAPTPQHALPRADVLRGRPRTPAGGTGAEHPTPVSLDLFRRQDMTESNVG